MADRVKGITIQIGGDTTGLSKALKDVNTDIRKTNTQLKDVNRLLKLDPHNVTLLAQKQRLLSREIGDTKDKLKQLKEANRQVKDSVKYYNDWKAAYDPIQSEIGDTEAKLKELKRAQEDMKESGKMDTAEYDALQREIDETGDHLKDLKQQAKDVSDEFGHPISQDQYDALQREIAETETSLQSLHREAANSNPALSIIKDGADAAADALGTVAEKTKVVSGAAAGVLGASAAGFMSYEGEIAKVSTLIDGTADEVQKRTESMSDQLLDFSNETGKSVNELAQAEYEVISAFGDSADAEKEAALAAKEAAAGNAALTDAVKLNSALTKAYGDTSYEAQEKVSDLAFTTVKLGQTSFGELASSMPQVTSLAKTMGVSVEELFGDYAALTGVVGTASEVSTKMKGALTSLLKPSDNMADALDALGYKSGQAAVEELGLNGTLEALYQSVDGDATKFGKLFKSTEALSFALAVTGDKAEGVNAKVAAMSDAAGATDEAFGKIANASGYRLEKSLNGVKNTAIQLGETMAPVIEEILGYVEQLVGYLAGLDESQLQMIVTVLAVVAAISPLATVLSTIFTGISNLMSAIQFITPILAMIPAPILAIIAAVMALIIAIAVFGDDVQAKLAQLDAWLQGVFKTDWTTVFGLLGNPLNALFANVSNIWNAIKLVFDGVINFIRGVFTGNWQRAWQGVVQIFSGVFAGLKAVAKAPINAVIGLVNTAISGINGVLNTISKLPGVSLPNIGKIPYLAKGGILSKGSAVVGEAGPELLTMDRGRAVVQPLTSTTSTTNNSFGATSINVYAAPGQSAGDIADEVMARMQHEIDVRRASLA